MLEPCSHRVAAGKPRSWVHAYRQLSGGCKPIYDVVAMPHMLAGDLGFTSLSRGCRLLFETTPSRVAVAIVKRTSEDKSLLSFTSLSIDLVRGAITVLSNRTSRRHKRRWRGKGIHTHRTGWLLFCFLGPSLFSTRRGRRRTCQHRNVVDVMIFLPVRDRHCAEALCLVTFPLNDEAMASNDRVIPQTEKELARQRSNGDG